jgi:hypothetical protein
VHVGATNPVADGNSFVTSSCGLTGASGSSYDNSSHGATGGDALGEAGGGTYWGSGGKDVDNINLLGISKCGGFGAIHIARCAGGGTLMGSGVPSEVATDNGRGQPVGGSILDSGRLCER